MNPILDSFFKYVWPFIIAWNIFIYQGQIAQSKEFSEFKLHVSKAYADKDFFEKTIRDFEKRLDDKLDLYLKYQADSLSHGEKNKQIRSWTK